jgi:hypothetical protein
MRAAAVKFGAIEIDRGGLGAIIKRKRADMARTPKSITFEQ